MCNTSIILRLTPLLMLTGGAMAPSAVWAQAADKDLGHDAVEFAFHGGPMMLALHDPQQFGAEGIQVGSGLGLGFGARLKLSERWAIEPLIELNWVEGQSYYGYTAIGLHGFLGARVDYAALPQLDVYGLIHLGVVLGGNADGTPVISPVWELGMGVRYMFYSVLGVFIEPQLSVFTAVDGSFPFVPGFKLTGGPAVLW